MAEYVLAHPDEVVNLSVTELAQKSSVSDATIVKFSQRIGYSGYQQFKIMLSRELARPPQANYGELDPDDDMPKVKAKVISMNMRALEQTLHTLSDAELERAVEALCAAPVIHIYGVGASGFVALDAEHKFLRINRRCHAFIDNHVQRAMATLLGPGDVAIGISNSGFTQDIVSALRIAREAGGRRSASPTILTRPSRRSRTSASLPPRKSRPSAAGPSPPASRSFPSSTCCLSGSRARLRPDGGVLGKDPHRRSEGSFRKAGPAGQAVVVRRLGAPSSRRHTAPALARRRVPRRPPLPDGRRAQNGTRPNPIDRGADGLHEPAGKSGTDGDDGDRRL